MVTYFVDFANGNDANTGLTFAQRKKNVPILGAGDEVRIMQSPAPTLVGSATWTNTPGVSRKIVSLAAAKTITIDNCQTAWTVWGGANTITAQDGSDRRQGTQSSTFQVTSSFVGPGKIFSKLLAPTLNLSAYRQISFWIKNTGSAISASTFKISLCSDPSGDVIVNDFPINFTIPASSNWIPIVIDFGAALGASIQSIALYKTVASAVAFGTFKLDNIIACLNPASADSITHRSLLSPQNGTSELWWPIESIDGTTIVLGRHQSDGSSNARGYVGTLTGAQNTYKLEPIGEFANSGSYVKIGFTFTPGGPGATISGGWDTGSMSSQTGDTYFSGITGFGSGITLSSTASGYTFSRLYPVGFATGWNFGSSNTTLNTVADRCGAVGCFTGLQTTNATASFTQSGTFSVNSCSSTGFFLNGGTNYTIGSIKAYDCGGQTIAITPFGAMIGKQSGTIDAQNNSAGISLGGLDDFENIIVRHNLTQGVRFSHSVGGNFTVKNIVSDTNGTTSLEFYHTTVREGKILNLTSSGHTNTVDVNSLAASRICKIMNVTASDTNLIVTGNLTFGWDQRVIFHKLNGSTDHRTYMPGGLIQSETVDRHTASGLAWRTTVNNANRGVLFPVVFGADRLRRAVNAGSTVTVKIWAKRSGSNIQGRLRILGGRLSGVPNDVITNFTTVGSYAEYTAVCTPSEAGVLEVVVDVWTTNGAITEYVLVDDMTWTQA